MMFKHIKHDIYGCEVLFEVELSLYLKLCFKMHTYIACRSKYKEDNDKFVRIYSTDDIRGIQTDSLQVTYWQLSSLVSNTMATQL